MTTKNDEFDVELVKKWTQIFRFYDVDNDGVLTKKDLDIVQNTISSKANLSEDKKREVSDLSNYMWAGMMEKEDDEEIHLNEYIAKRAKMKKNGTLAGAAIEYRKRLFYCMDLNQDNKINFSEFLMFADCLGKSDTRYLDVAFNEIDKGGRGEVTLEQYTNAYAKYVDDPSVTIETLPLFGLPE